MKISERAFQNQVVQLAEMCGWLVFHNPDSRMVRAGLPDLLLIGDGVVIFAELKTDGGRLRPDQVTTIRRLQAAGQLTYLWRPRHFNQITAVLRKQITPTQEMFA